MQQIAGAGRQARQRRRHRQAQLLYEESDASRAERQKRTDQRRWGTEPSLQLKGRPTKRNRRLLEKFASREADPADNSES